LKQLLAGDDASMMRALTFGVATRVPGLVGTGGIVQEARDKAISVHADSAHAHSSPDAST
jgi:hypothetical protein